MANLPRGGVYVPSVQGLPGPTGPQGPPGASPAVFTQAFDAAPVWTVNHNLGRVPAAVTVATMGGLVAEVAIVHVSVNQLQISFSAPLSGVVYVG